MSWRGGIEMTGEGSGISYSNTVLDVSSSEHHGGQVHLVPVAAGCLDFRAVHI